MKLRLKLLIVPLILAVILTLPVAAGAQTPELPHYFYGSVSINGVPAPAGTTIEGRVTGAVNDPANPIAIVEAGLYGSANKLADVPRLLVQGGITDGATVEFYVNGLKAVETAAWHSGETSEVNLSVVSTTSTRTSRGGRTTESPLPAEVPKPEPTATTPTAPPPTTVPVPATAPAPAVTPSPTPVIEPVSVPSAVPENTQPASSAPVTQPMNWGLLAGLIAAALVIAGIAIVVVNRRNARG